MRYEDEMNTDNAHTGVLELVIVLSVKVVICRDNYDCTVPVTESYQRYVT